MREGKRKKEHYSLVPRLSDTLHSEEWGTFGRRRPRFRGTRQLWVSRL